LVFTLGREEVGEEGGNDDEDEANDYACAERERGGKLRFFSRRGVGTEREGQTHLPWWWVSSSGIAWVGKL